MQAALHSTKLGNYPSHAGKETPVQKAGGQQIGVLQNVQVFGTGAVAYLPKEQKQGAEQPSTRHCIYLGMSEEVPNGQRPVAYYKNDKGAVVLMGVAFEWASADLDLTHFPDVPPLRRPEGPGPGLDRPCTSAVPSATRAPAVRGGGKIPSGLACGADPPSGNGISMSLMLRFGRPSGPARLQLVWMHGSMAPYIPERICLLAR